jgi:hypothetical protein
MAFRSIQNLFLIGPRQNNEDYKSERELFLDYASIAARLFTFEGLTIRTITLGVRKPPPQRDPAILPRGYMTALIHSSPNAGNEVASFDHQSDQRD